MLISGLLVIPVYVGDVAGYFIPVWGLTGISLGFRYLLQPKGNCKTSKADELGSLRLNVTYIEDTVLPSACYERLRALMLKSPDVKVPRGPHFGPRLAPAVPARSLPALMPVPRRPSPAHLRLSGPHPGGPVPGALRGRAAHGAPAAAPQQPGAVRDGRGGSGAGEHAVSAAAAGRYVLTC